RGVGRRLIEDLVALGRARGWSRLYWHTRRDNPARKLYDTFVQADDFVRYQLAL
ncbi:GNAT family N-acetyltransferase, partial [Paraburkholderia sp. SIMBA_050]